MVHSCIKLFAACAAFAAAPMTASADLLIDVGPASTNSLFSTGNYVAGSEFTIDSPRTIRSLGWLDAEGDGLTATHQIGLWSVATQSLLTSATVTPSSFIVASAHGTAQWFMAGVADLLLPAGTYRVAGEVSGDALPLANHRNTAAGVSISAGYVRTDFPNGGFAYPNLTFGANAVRATVSTDPIPAPMSILILAAGALLPLAETTVHSQRFGTRHRAALGITEQTDAVVVVV
ncbi:MAG: DNA integrity scanning protein DisA nucleotide-binding domain protein, partial [Dehalococcoidia bacterium]